LTSALGQTRRTSFLSLAFAAATAFLATAFLATAALLLATAATFFAGARAVALVFRTGFQFLFVGDDEDALALVGGLFHFQRGLGG